MLELQLNLLGPPEIRLASTPLSFPTRKTLALLVYLALEGGPQPREHLAAMLWPEATPERSHASLRNTLGHLKSVLQQTGGQANNNYLSVTHTALALNPDANITLDLHVVERAYLLARADRSSRTLPEGSASLPMLQAAADSYRGDFLVGFSLSDASAFDDWASNQQEVWRRRLGLILDRLSEIQFAQGDLASAAETASQWISLDPLNEGAYRRKMRAHFAAGERGQALETYDLCRTALEIELGIEPEADTQALAVRIRTQQILVRSTSPPIILDTPLHFLESLFAGRSEEHQVLVKLFGLAATGNPQMVVLHGEAGIGKTRLAREFLRWVETQGAALLQGRAFEGGSRLSYQPIVEAFRPVIRRESIFAAWLDEAGLAPLSYLLPDLRDRYPELSGSPINTEQSHFFEALVRLTLTVAEQQPLVLFLDDLQWADSATLDWLVYAVRRWQESRTPILLFVSLRSAALHPPTQPDIPSLMDWLTQVERETKPYLIELDPLSEHETLHMVLGVLEPPAPDFAQWVFNETQGHPFYLMETLKDLLERRAIRPKRQANGQWTFEVDVEHDLGRAVRVPSTVRAVIRSRLNRLSPNAFTLLVAGAILEQRLTFDYLCAIANMPEDFGLPALDELLSGRLLVEIEQPGHTSTYAFANDMLRDVVYTEAGDARRRSFHKRALELLEAGGNPAALLAYHAVAAGLAESTFLHSLTAGQEALRLAAAREAQAHLEQARQLALDGTLNNGKIESQLRDLYLQLAQAYELSNQPAQARAVYDEMRRLSSSGPDVRSS